MLYVDLHGAITLRPDTTLDENWRDRVGQASGLLTTILTQWDRAEIERFVEAAIELLNVIDGDPDREECDEDCCAAWDDCGGISLAGRVTREWNVGEECDAEDDCHGLPCVVHGAYQGTNGFGFHCDLVAGDTFECGPAIPAEKARPERARTVGANVGTV